MEFSQYQLERIARFAAASETVHRNRVLLLTPGMTKPTLALAMRAKRPPQISEPSFAAAIEAFTELSAHSVRSRRANRLVPIGLSLAAVCAAFVWGRVGPAMAIAVILAMLLAIGMVKGFYGYFGLRPIMQRFALTDEEAAFALNEVIADPRWQADL